MTVSVESVMKQRPDWQVLLFESLPFFFRQKLVLKQM